MEEFQDDTLGLSFLMNNKKKVASDAISISSGRSSLADPKSDASSVKSIRVEPNFIDVNEHLSSRPYSPQKQQFFNEEQDEENYSSEQDESSGQEGSEMDSLDSRYKEAPKNMGRSSEEDVLNAKKELLYQFERLEKKGMRLPKKFTLASNLEEMKMEYERLKRDRDVDASIRFQRRMTMAVVSGVEFVSGKFDFIGARLDGWSEKVYDDIDDYDDIFEELHEKYRGKGKMAPELRLLMSLGGSAFMFHMTNRYSNTLPGLDQVLKNNPELARQLAEATTKSQQQQQQASGNFFGNILGNMFGGGMPQASYPPNPPPQQSQPTQLGANKTMKGPSNVDDILRELESNNNDRIEVMSAITSADMSDIPDDESSINGLILGGGKKKKKGLSLDI